MPAPSLVVIGGSAGGIKALRGIFQTLRRPAETAVCVVLHRPPDFSPLAEVLQSYTAIPVGEPLDSPWECVPGTVTMAPAGYHLIVGPGRRPASAPATPVTPSESAPGVRAHLTLDAPVTYSRPSLDVTFTSAAVFGSAAVAVLLSCANVDGAAGCAAVKAAGGRVVLQDPATCEAASAVNAAMRRVTPDHVGDPVEIGTWLTRATMGA